MTVQAYFYSLDVISDLIFGQSLGLLKKPDFRWLVQALADGNRYMYLQFAWPEVLKSRLAFWVNPSRWIFPSMSRESESFARLSSYFREQRRSMAGGMQSRKDITAALEAAVNPSGQRMTEHEIWTEALMLLRAGTCTLF
jgi:cytochrome P450